jgi:hypothetical protein
MIQYKQREVKVSCEGPKELGIDYMPPITQYIK